MSGFKAKAAYFENLFSNLDKDSDDDEDVVPIQPAKEASPVPTVEAIEPERDPPPENSFIELSSSPESSIHVPSSPVEQIIIASSPEVDGVDIPSSPEHEVVPPTSPEAELDNPPGENYICLSISDDESSHNTHNDVLCSSINQSDINNTLTLKFQDGNRKHMREIQVAPDEPLKRPKEDYAREFNIDITTMKLFFDGDLISDQDTCAQLDIEDGCVIDVVLPQTISYVPPPSPIDLASPPRRSPRVNVTTRGRGRGRGRGGARGRGGRRGR